MARIFIGYRRDDSAGHVGWLRHLLSQQFGADEIFRDIDTIPSGVDFVEAIEAGVGSCEVLLAVIGPRWLTAADTRGRRRLDNPEDFVRVEIATALERNIRVIPVLVQDAVMPRSDELPPALGRLARRQAVALRDVSWDYDVGRLITALESILQPQASPTPPTQPVAAQPQPALQTDALRSRLLKAESEEDWDTVIAVGTEILRIDSTDQSIRRKTANAYNNRGNTRYNQDDLQGTLADYNQAISLDPDYARAYNNRGNARYDLGDLQGALVDYNQAISLDPDYAPAYNNRGTVWDAQGNLQGALGDYNQAISLDPGYAFAYYNRGRLHLAQNKRAAARQDLQRAAALGDEDAKKELAKL